MIDFYRTPEQLAKIQADAREAERHRIITAIREWMGLERDMGLEDLLRKLERGAQ